MAVGDGGLSFLLPMAGVFVVLLGILMLLSWFLAAHIRRQMMGMEPKQIARVVRQQEALVLVRFYERADCESPTA
ncbi:hypothetical protein SU67_24970, partial [Escherichia coli O139:H28 str. E24377A]